MVSYIIIPHRPAKSHIAVVCLLCEIITSKPEVVFENPIEAKKARQLGEIIVAQSGASKDIEVFPKQDKVPENGFGNLIKLPLGIHKISGQRSYLLREDLNRVDDWANCLLKTQKISKGQVDDILRRCSGPESVCRPENKTEKWITQLLEEGSSEGVRDKDCFRLFSHFKSKGEPADIAEAILRTTWLKKTQERTSAKPFTEQEFLKCKDSAYKNVSFLEPRPIINLNDFLKQEIHEQESYWGDGLITKESRIFVSGLSKIGKTFFALELAIMLARGESFLGFEVFRPLRVLLLQQEISEGNLQQRLKMLLEDGEVPGNFFLQTTCIKVDKPDGLERLRSYVESIRPDIVMMDPLYKFHSKDENSSTEVKSMLDKIDSIMYEFGTAFLIIHHNRKPRDFERPGATQMRGSSTFFDWGDTYMTLNYAKGTDRESGYVRIDFECRNCENPNPLLLKKNENGWFEVKVVLGEKKLAICDVVQKVKEMGGEVERKVLKAVLAESYYVKESTANNRISEALKNKELIHLRGSYKNMVLGLPEVKNGLF